MRTSRSGSIFSVLVPFLMLAGCKEPGQVERPRDPTAAEPEIGVVASSGKVEPQYLVGKFCNIESINDQMLGAEPFRISSTSSVRGWLADGEGRVLEQPMLVLTDENDSLAKRYPLRPALSRPDVVNVFPGQPIREDSGFELRMDPKGLASRSYRLHLAYRAGEQWYACDNGRVIIVP